MQAVHTPFLALASLTLGLCLQTTGIGQVSEGDRQQLVYRIGAPEDAFESEKTPDFKLRRQQLRAAIEDARLFFARATDAANFAAWMDYLDVEELETAISRPAADLDRKARLVEGRLAKSLVYRLIGTAPGLELSRLQRLRTASQRFIASVKFGDESGTKKIPGLVKALRGKIESIESAPSSADRAFINRILDELDQANQAGEAIRSVRDRFNYPNARLLVSEGMIQRIANRPVNQSQQIRDCILGTRLVGTASLNGYVTADLQPCIGSSKLRVSLNGRFCSQNTGYNGPISLTTVGQGNVQASRNLYIDDASVRRDTVQVWADLRTAVTGINHPLRIVRAIARRKAAQQKPQADRIAQAKLRERVAAQFTRETDQAAQFSVSDWLRQVTPTLRRLDLPTPSQAWSSTDDRVRIDVMMRADTQVGSESPPPFLGNSFSLAVQLHETTIDNVATKILAGRTMTKDKLRELLKIAGRDSPIRDDEKSSGDFEIDFAAIQPLVFEARNGRLTIGIRGTRFAQDGREVKGSSQSPLEISATYSPARYDGRWVLIRDKEINVTYRGSDRGGVKRTAERGRIRESFAKVFPDLLLDRTITVPQTATVEAVRGMAFTVSQMSADKGWLTLAIQ